MPTTTPTGSRPLIARRALLLAASLLVAAATGCTPRTDDRDIRWVTPEEAQRAMYDRTGVFGMGGAPNGLYVDPRSTNQYVQGHIPGAANIPFPRLDAMYPTIRDRTVLVVYSTDYADDAFAGGASKRLLELGASHVLTIRGGLKAWKQSGGEVVDGPEPGGASPSPPATPATAPPAAPATARPPAPGGATGG